ncbi:Glutathione S-transferase zeta-1 [Mortierella sp. AD032]|nr:Glutathione S-transferase zeta-1 [Mortierella sp. AD032]
MTPQPTATASPRPVLYSFYRSSCAWRVRLALNLKNVPFETRPINLLAEQNKTPEYKAIQPFGAVPAFLEANSQGQALVESVAILEYLDETRPALETMLEKTAGKYSFGDSVTMADLLLVPQFYNGIRFNVDMSAYPIMSRINSELETIPAFQASHPTKQPDCPPELR